MQPAYWLYSDASSVIQVQQAIVTYEHFTQLFSPAGKTDFETLFWNSFQAHERKKSKMLKRYDAIVSIW